MFDGLLRDLIQINPFLIGGRMKEKLVLREDGLVLAVLPPEEDKDESLFEPE